MYSVSAHLIIYKIYFKSHKFENDIAGKTVMNELFTYYDDIKIMYRTLFQDSIRFIVHGHFTTHSYI